MHCGVPFPLAGGGRQLFSLALSVILTLLTAAAAMADGQLREPSRWCSPA